MVYKRNGRIELTVYLSEEERAQLNELGFFLGITGKGKGNMTNSIQWAIRTCYEASKEELESIKKKLGLSDE